MENIKEFQRNDRVRVDNCYAWEIGFHSDVARRDILIPGGAKGYALLTVDQVEDEIIKQHCRYATRKCINFFSAVKITPTILAKKPLRNF